MTTRPISTPPAAMTAGSPGVVPSTMRAIVQDTYGPVSEVLKLQVVPVPVPEDDEVVVRVHAASIHVGDLVSIKGEPVIARMATGLRRPTNRVPGTDIAGTVTAVGSAVQHLRPGDEVFGWCTGAFAEYVCAEEDHFAPKPTSLTFEQAAAVGVSATAALQLLRDRVHAGQKVLINGASGGLGSYAVQIAAAFGAEVTGVCGSRNLDTVRSLGAEHVIDYAQDDFTTGGRRYDFILDNVANHSLARTRRALAQHGVLQSNNGTSGGRWFGTMGTVIKTAVLSRFTPRQAPPSIKFSTRADLLILKELIDAGRVTPLIDRTFPLAHAARAVSHVEGGHARGTVVLRIGTSDEPEEES